MTKTNAPEPYDRLLGDFVSALQQSPFEWKLQCGPRRICRTARRVVKLQIRANQSSSGTGDRGWTKDDPALPRGFAG